MWKNVKNLKKKKTASRNRQTGTYLALLVSVVHTENVAADCAFSTSRLFGASRRAHGSFEREQMRRPRSAPVRPLRARIRSETARPRTPRQRRRQTTKSKPGRSIRAGAYIFPAAALRNEMNTSRRRGTKGNQPHPLDRNKQPCDGVTFERHACVYSAMYFKFIRSMEKSSSVRAMTIMRHA